MDNEEQIKQYREILSDMIKTAGDDIYLLSIHTEEIQRLKEEINKLERGMES